MHGKHLLPVIFSGALIVFLASNNRAADPAPAIKVTPDDALKQLMAGNARFAKGKALHPRRGPEDFRAVSKAQYPLAVVIACADSRVAPELVFDSGIGDLFVIRAAGNVVEGAGVTVKGSIEYAIAELNVP